MAVNICPDWNFLRAAFDAASSAAAASSFLFSSAAASLSSFAFR
jgi:hypothetical protein